MSGFEVLEDEHDRPSIAVFDRTIPTIDDMRYIARKGYEARFVNIPPGYEDLRFLLDLAPFVIKLGIADSSVEDVTVVTKLTGLKELDLEVEQHTSVDLSPLVNLTSFAGDLKHFESALALPALKHLFLRSAGKGRLSSIRSPLRTLEMLDLGSMEALPSLAHPSSLRSLSLRGMKRFSLEGISAYEKLRSVEIAECRELAGVEELTALRLKVVYLEKIAHVDEVDSLLSLRARRVVVSGRNPFTSAFRERASRTRVDWAYFGRARTPAP
jgi:hypothetical protein